MRQIFLPLPVVAAFMRPMYRGMLHPKLSFRSQRALMELASKSQPVPRGTVTRQQVVAGVPVERVTVGATQRRTAILYLHGGAFTAGSPNTHRPLTASLAKYTGSVVFVPDYRLAPEHPYPAALDDAEAVWDAMVSDFGFAPKDIAIAGDSAGGNLSIALARRLVRKGSMPAALGLLSPWVDPGDRNPPFERDLVVNTGWSNASSNVYINGGDRTDPGFAPALGSLTGLPPTVLHIGTSEVLYNQVRTFAGKLAAAGVEVEYREHEKLWHVAQLQATMMREADDSVRDISAFLLAKLSAEVTASSI